MTTGKILCSVFPALAVALIISRAPSARAATGTSATTTHHRKRLRGFGTLAAARAACGADTVVWHAKDSKVFHGAASKYFGRTKGGAYVCEKEAIADHLRASRY